MKTVLTCDHCHKKFTLRKTLFRETIIGSYRNGKVKKKYFSCSHCKTEYPFEFEDVEVRDQKKRIKQLQNKTRGLTPEDGEKFERFVRAWKEARDQYMLYQAELREHFQE